jgi:Telomerase ribonucleoprotein complex - RNA binding domain
MSKHLLDSIFSSVETLESFISSSSPSASTFPKPFLTSNPFFKSILVCKRRFESSNSKQLSSIDRFRKRKGDDPVMFIVYKIIYRDCVNHIRSVLSCTCKEAEGTDNVFMSVRTDYGLHLDYFLLNEWKDTLFILGEETFSSILGMNTNYVLLKTLPNKCLMQLTGISVNEDVDALFSIELSVPKKLLDAAPSRTTSSSASPTRSKRRRLLGPTFSINSDRSTSTTSISASQLLEPLDSVESERDSLLAKPTTSKKLPQGAVPGRWILPRASNNLSASMAQCVPIFYSASFRKRPGFNSGHVLNKLVKNTDLDLASIQLTSSVFIDAAHLDDLALFNAPSDKYKGGYGAKPSDERQVLHLFKKRPNSMNQPSVLPKSLARVPGLFRGLLERHVKCEYGRLLETSCPRSKDKGKLTPNETKLTHAQVHSFVCSVLDELVQDQLWGDESAAAKRSFYAFLSSWITRGVFDKIRVDELMNGVPTKAFSIFGSDSIIQRHCVQCWYLWLLLVIVSHLLKSHFYITESEIRKNTPLYYRKPTWARLRHENLDKLKQSLALSPITKPDPRSLGFARLRQVPKASSMRPIMNLSASSKKSGKGGSVNKELRPLKLLLEYLCQAQPSVVGSSVAGLSGIHAAMLRFMKERARRDALIGTSARGNPPLFVYSCDISSAFDTIQHDMLLKLLKGMISPYTSSTFQSRQYLSVSSRMPIYPETVPKTQIDRLHSFFPYPPPPFFSDNPTYFFINSAFFKQVDSLALRSKNKLFIDTGREMNCFPTNLLLSLLERHICNHQVRLPNGKTMKQNAGIPQGSTVSTLLCNIYLGDMETKYVIPTAVNSLRTLELKTNLDTQFIHRIGSISDSWDDSGDELQVENASDQTKEVNSISNPSSLEIEREIIPSSSPPALQENPFTVICRSTDDYIILSESEEIAKAIAKALIVGSPQYQMRINPAKTQMNFNVYDQPQSINRDNPIRWCGIMFHPKDNSVTLDYSRHFEKDKVQDSMVISLVKTPTISIFRLLRLYFKPFSFPILLDGNLLTLGNVSLNVFQIALLAATKFVYLLRFIHPKGSSKKKEAYIRFLSEEVERSIDFYYYVIKARLPGKRTAKLEFGEERRMNTDNSGGSNHKSHSHGKVLLGTKAEVDYCTGASKAPGKACSSCFPEVLRLNSYDTSLNPTSEVANAVFPLKKSEVKWLSFCAFEKVAKKTLVKLSEDDDEMKELLTGLVEKFKSSRLSLFGIKRHKSSFMNSSSGSKKVPAVRFQVREVADLRKSPFLEI